MCSYLVGLAPKVGKKAKIRNQYNQVPHLTQDIVWKIDKKTSHTGEPRSHRSALSKQVLTQTRHYSKDKLTQNQKIHKRSTALERPNFWSFIFFHLFCMSALQGRTGPGPEVIKKFSCSTQLSIKFQLLISPGGGAGGGGGGGGVLSFFLHT